MGGHLLDRERERERERDAYILVLVFSQRNEGMLISRYWG